MESFLHRLLVGAARLRGETLFARFRQQTAQVAQVQAAVLLAKVRRNADSQLGRDHRFDRVHDVASFQRSFPISEYGAFAPYVERVKNGETQAMFGSGQRVRMFSKTSGTSGAAKFIPVTDDYLREYRRFWLLWGLGAFRTHPRLLDGKLFSLVGDWDEHRTAGGIPCGSVSGLVRTSQPYAARARYCLPDCIMRVRDVRAKYYLALRLALAQRRISLVAVANPATLIGTAAVADEHKASLIRDLADGTFSPPGPVPTAVSDRAAPVAAPSSS